LLTWDIQNLPWDKSKQLASLTIMAYDAKLQPLGVVAEFGIVKGTRRRRDVSLIANADRHYVLDAEIQSVNHTAGVNAVKWIAVTVLPKHVEAGFSGTIFFNCTDARHQMYIWMRDVTANTAWVKTGPITDQ